MRNSGKHTLCVLGIIALFFIATYMMYPNLFTIPEKDDSVEAIITGKTIVQSGLFSSKEICVIMINETNHRTTNSGCIYNEGDTVLVKPSFRDYFILEKLS